MTKYGLDYIQVGLALQNKDNEALKRQYDKNFNTYKP